MGSAHSNTYSYSNPLTAYFYDYKTGAAIKNSLIIGNSDPSSTSSLAQAGLIIAWVRRFE